jgi:hypothetical protein
MDIASKDRTRCSGKGGIAMTRNIGRITILSILLFGWFQELVHSQTAPTVYIDLYQTNGNSVTEGPGNYINFTVHKMTLYNNDLVVNYTVSGSARNGIDYNSLSGQVTLSGLSCCAPIQIRPIDNSIIDGMRSVTVTLTPSTATPATYYVDSVQNSSTVYIVDDDGPDLIISQNSGISPSSVIAGDSVLVGSWTVKNQGKATVSGFEYAYYLQPGNILLQRIVFVGSLGAGQSYVFPGTTLLPIPASTVPGSYQLEIRVDDTNQYAESNEDNNSVSLPLTVVLPNIEVQVITPSSTEGSVTPARFRLNRNQIGKPMTVYYTVTDNFGRNTPDYTLSPAQAYAPLPNTYWVTFPTNGDILDVTVLPTDDSTAECPETVTLRIINDPTSPSPTYQSNTPTNQGSVSIMDNDYPSVYWTSTGPFQINEGSTTPLTLSVRRYGCTSGSLTIPYEIGGTAINGTDYNRSVPLTGSVTIGATNTSANITITPYNDTLLNGDRTITLHLLSGSYYLPGTTTVTVTIIDNEAPLTITTSSLPNGTVGVSYGQSLAASGGTTPYTWSVSQGSLPPGVTLNANGTLSGTPTQTGTYPFTVQVTDSSSPARNTTAALSITIAPAPSVTITTNPTGLSITVDGVGYTAPQTFPWTAGSNHTIATSTPQAGSRPTNRYVFNNWSDGGTLSHTVTTPSNAVTYTANFKTQYQLTLSSVPAAGGTININPSSPDGFYDSGTNLTLTAVANPGYSFRFWVGDIGGNPGTANPISVGAGGRTIEADFLQNLAILATILPGGQVGVAYNQTLAASGGTSPYSWSISQGSLPPGLTMSASGVISGQPTKANIYSFTVRVTDSSSPAQSATAALSITITTTTPALTITTSTLPSGQTGVTYNQPLTASGGATPYSWSISQGTLPPGLSLSSGNVISGQPTQAGSYPFTVRVTDKSSPMQSATAALSITITTTAPVLKITTTALPDGQTGVAYNQPLVATGGTTAYSWSLSQGLLPPGLALSTDGIISGQPTQAGSYPFTVQVTDKSSPMQSATTALNILISASGGALKITTVSPLPDGIVGASYSQQLAASGGLAPYTWWISSFFGALPDGLTLDGATGLISGTPKTAGQYAFTMNVTDSSTPSKQTVSGAFSIKVGTTPSATISIVATDPKSSESGPKAGILTVNRTGNTSAPLIVLYSIGGTAVNGTDYQTLPGTITIPAGAASGTITLMPIDDNLPEGDETVLLTLKPDPAYTVGSPNNAGVTIEDNDQNVVTIVATDPEASETGPKAGVFTVSRTGNTSWALTVDLQVGGSASSGIDYNPLPNTITLKVGESSTTLTVLPVDDTLYEYNETVVVTLRPGNYLRGNPSAATVSIKDNETTPIITQVQGKPDTIAPAAQPKAEVLIDKPADQDIAGDLVLVFNHNADAALETNPEVRFSNGSSRLHFTIPAQTKQVQFGDNVDGSFQGGTVAGTITLQATMASGWQGPPPPSYQVTIRRAPAIITDFTIANRTSNSFDLVVTGYSTPRSLRSITFTFSPSSGNTVNNAVQNLDVNAGAVTWFESDTSKQLGGNFRMTIPFTFSGSINAISSVAVTVVNVEGTSDSRSAIF